MKFIYFTISLFLSQSSFAQDWTFHKADKSSDHRYEYWFRFDNIDDSCTYSIERHIEFKKSRISLLNNKGKKIIFANVKLKDLETDSIETLSINSEGIGEKC